MNGRFSKLEASAGLAGPLADLSANPLSGEAPRDAAYYIALATGSMHDGLHESALRLFTRCLKEDRSRIPAWVGQLQMLLELREEIEARLWAGKALEVFKGNGELLACQAQANLRAGDQPAAIAQSDQSLGAPGSSPLRWIARGEVMLHGAPALAAECFERAATEDGADWFVSVRIARVYLRHRRPAPAAEHAASATRARPESPFAWVTLAECHERLGSLIRAAECYEAAFQLAPTRREFRDRIRDCSARSESTFSKIRRLFGR